MASLETEKNYVEIGEKRKNDEVVEKVKKKKKSKHVIETMQDSNELIEKVKKKKKKSSQEETFDIKEETIDENIEEKNLNISKSTVSNAKTKLTKTQELSTVSIAVPGSILDNAQSPEFRTYLAGQIARAACIYKIDEVCYLFILLSIK